MAKIHPGKNNTQKGVIAERAAVLFKQKGFKATSMRQLADAVGVEAPSLYNHIGSKSELLQLICFKVADKFTVNLSTIENQESNVKSKIESVIRFHIRMMLDNFLNQRRNYEKRLVALIEKGINKKEFKKNNAYVIVLTILSAVRGLEFWQRHKKNITQTVLEDTMVDHLLNGIIK
jgi:AcrR family transcriptional regulator